MFNACNDQDNHQFIKETIYFLGQVLLVIIYIDRYDGFMRCLVISFNWIHICNNASRAMRTKKASKLFFVIILLSLFIIFFGAPSLKHFLREPVLVEIDREEFEDLEFPRISFCPFEKSSESWIKGSEPDMLWIQNLCSKSSFEKVGWLSVLWFIQYWDTYLLKVLECVRDRFYHLNESIGFVIRGRTPQTSLPLTSDLWRSSLTHVGLCHTLTHGRRLGADLNHDSLIIGLNSSLFYRVAIYDPVFFEVWSSTNSITQILFLLDER